MPAYMIVFADIKDREKFIAGYAPAASKLVAKHGGKYLIRAAGSEVLEGQQRPGVSVVISEWPDKAAILRFWNSPEYQAAKAKRQGAGIANIVLVEGV